MKKGGDGIQVDKGGFVRIHHTILEVLATAPLRGQQLRCLMFLFRKTYGFNKREAKISLKEWADGTGMRRQNVWRELQSLMKCNVIVAQSNGEKRAMTWGFNKYHEQWCFESVITDDDKSVITDDDSFRESVITDDYRMDKSVIVDDDKSVITRTHTRDLKDNKDNTTTTNGSGGSSELFSSQQSPVARCWQDNMQTPLTQIIMDDLEKSVEEYGERAVIDAIATAVRAESRTMRYVKGVLIRQASVPRASPVNGTGGYAGMILVSTENDDD